MSKEQSKCAECREEVECIWIESPVKDAVSEEKLCERCYDHLNVKGGGAVVRGSQWAGEV